MAGTFGAVGCAVVLFLIVFSDALAQDSNTTRFTCHCHGPHFCDDLSPSCVAEQTSEIEIACVIYKEFHSGGLVVSGASCFTPETHTSYLIECEEPFQTRVRTEDGVPYKTIASLCCKGDYCNSQEALEKVIDTLSPTDYPPSFVTPTSATNQSIYNSKSPTSTSTPSEPNSSSSDNSSSAAPVYAVIIIILLSLTVVVIVTVIVVILALHHCLPRRSRRTTKGTGSSIVTVDSNSYSGANLNELIEEYSGSGSGLPLLNKRSISGQIALHNIIGKGRFGEVWKGLYKGDFVAVKIFHTKEEGSWFHEVEIYQTCLLRHPNVLRFIAADNCDVGLQTQLWVITEYCEYGSLYDLLSRETFTQANALRLCYTAASGLDHLHTEIVGSQCKPAIAHRDLKSRNILVKSGYTCCVADLGLSLTYQQARGLLKTPSRATVGTRRYLAPEILSEEINVKNFESFKRSDIYSFSLVMWEIGRRAECDGHAEEAQLPYFDLIQSDPTLEEVQKVVCQEQRRPSLPNPWNKHEAMVSLSRIIQQCWLHTPEARLTSLRIKKSLANLKELLLKDVKDSDMQT